MKHHSIMFVCMTLAATLTPAIARASWVNSCLLEAVVLQPTSTLTQYRDDGSGEYEVSFLTIEFRVKKARPNGRADSGCDQFIGQKKTVKIDQPPRVRFSKGDRIQLNYFAKDGKSLPFRESYTLILPNTLR